MRRKRKPRGELTAAIIQCTNRPGIGMRTATEIAHELNHPPAIVSGILARLSKQHRVLRLAAADSVGPRLDLKPGTWVY